MWWRKKKKKKKMMMMMMRGEEEGEEDMRERQCRLNGVDSTRLQDANLVS